jgi:protocatechuate 3,4-dioxygenase beta subunit
MRFRVSLFMLFASFGLFLAGTTDTLAKDKSPQQAALQKARILESINILRASQGQRPLLWTKSLATPQARVALSSGAIAGRLNGIDRSTVVNAWVVAWSTSADSGTVAAYYGDIAPNGDYKIGDVPEGEHYVLAAAEGYYPNYYKNTRDFSEATPVKVSAGAVTEGIDFDMEQIKPGDGSISGVVVRELDDAPIRGATVSVFSTENPFISGWVETAEDGTYRLGALSTGKYYAYVRAEGYLPEYFDDAESFEQADLIDVVDPNETKGIDFKLGIGGSISGKVTNEEGAPIAGAYVQTAPTAFDSALGVRPDGTYLGTYGWAVTDDQGDYTIGGLAAGSYKVLAQAWTQWFIASEWYDNSPSFEDATPVQVEKGKETSGIDFKLDLPVTNGFIAGTVVDLQDQPIAGAYVYAETPFNDPTNPPSGRVYAWAYAITERDGSYRIEGLPDGKYLVSASAYNQWQYVQRWWPDAETPAKAEPVIVDSGAEPVPINFRLPLTTGSASIAGIVRNENGDPLANAFIDISSPFDNVDPATGVVKAGGIWAYGFSDSSGHYRVDQLPPGTYIVHAQYWENLSFGQEWYDNADNAAAATPVTIAAGEARDGVDFSIKVRPLYGAIAGTVVNDATGDVISRAYVELSPQGYAFWEGAPFMRWPYYAVTDDKGNYRLEWLPEGEYLVSVYANGAFEYFENATVAGLATPVKVAGGETTTVNFGLTPRNEGAGIISGRVGAEYTDQLLEIAVVVAKPVATILVWPQSDMFFNAVINKDGTYEISGLPAGDYYVMSFAPGYMPEYYKDQFDPTLADQVKVDGITPATGIDFSLSPVWYLRGPEDGGPAVVGGASVFGKVTDASGKPLAGATVYAFNGEGRAVSSARCFADGSYEMQGLPPGSYRLQASNLGYASECNGGVKNLDEAAQIDLGRGRVEVNFVLDPRITTGVGDQPPVPKEMELYGNYPNPFNPETRISFGLPSAMRVKVRVFNLLGKEVALLHDGLLNAGEQHLTWNGRDRAGNQVTSGLYFYRLEGANGAALVGKMLMMK